MAAPFLVDGDEAFIGAAVGIAIGDGVPATEDVALTVDQLVSDAGVAMARAANEDGGVEVYDAEMRAEVEERRTLEMRLRGGLERGEFQLAYQAIVELADERLLGFEALARWTDPPTPGMGPAQFIPVAEAAGLIGALGSELLGQACAQLAHWQRIRPDVFVSVNLSARQLAEPDLPARVAAALATAGADPSGLHLEITETVLLDDVDRAVATLQELKLTGVRLCLDDFGTGYSSLTYLARLRSTWSRSTAPSWPGWASPTGTRRWSPPSSGWPARSATSWSPKASRPPPRPAACGRSAVRWRRGTSTPGRWPHPRRRSCSAPDPVGCWAHRPRPRPGLAPWPSPSVPRS